MIEEFVFLASGIILGLTLGISPGPLLTLVVSETLKYNRKEGIKIAIAPMITDLPIILATLLILSKLSNLNTVLGFISISGGIFIGYLSYKNIFIKELKFDIDNAKPQSLKKGIIANFLNPAPYIFWLIVAAPIVLKASQISLFSALLFPIGFYFSLIGSKILIAIITEKSRFFLKGSAYLYTIKFLGIALLIFSFILLKDGLNFLEII